MMSASDTFDHVVGAFKAVDAGHTTLAFFHDNGASHRETRQAGGEDSLRLRVINGVVTCKIGGHPGVAGAETAGNIQHALAAQQVDQPA